MIDTAEINGQKKTIIYISPKGTLIPRTMLQGKRDSGYIYKDGQIQEWYWQGFTQKDDNRYIYCEPIDIMPLGTLFSLPPEEAAIRAGEIAALFSESGLARFIPEDSIFLIRDGGALVLPESIMELQITGKTEAENYESYQCWVRPGFRGIKAAVYLVTSYLYKIITGITPLKEQDSRDNNYNPVPASLLNSSLSPKETSWIMDILQAKKQDSLPDFPTWFEQYRNFRESLESMSPAAAGRTESPNLAAYLERQAKKAKRSRFLRKRGGILAAVSLIAIAAIAFGVSMVSNALKPPAQAGLPPEDMIAIYYQSQNNLDSVTLDDCLARGVKSSAENIVTYLYVTSRTRMAYEQTDGLVMAQDWIDQGMPELEASEMVFGITDLSITRIDADTFLAEYDFWMPDTGSDTEEEQDSELTEISAIEISQLRIAEELDVIAKKDYWLISDIRRIAEEEVE